MNISCRLITVGNDPEIDFARDTVMVKFSGAENHNKNVGTYEDPIWERSGTSWYNFVAFGEVAQQIIDQLKKGTAFELIKGTHKWVNLGTKEDPDWRANYVIREFKRYE